MIERSPFGQCLGRRALSRVALMIMVFACSSSLDFGVGNSNTTMAEIDGADVTATTASDTTLAVDVQPTPITAAVPTDSPPEISEPTATMVIAVEPTSSATPATVPAESSEPILFSEQATEPSPTETQTPFADPPLIERAGTDETVNPLPHDREYSTSAVETCEPASGSSNSVVQGGRGFYDCLIEIAFDPGPMPFATIDLDWTVTAHASSGWIVDLRNQGNPNNGVDQIWADAARPGLHEVEQPPAIDSKEVDHTDSSFSFAVNYGLRLTAPACGGPENPEVIVGFTVRPTIDGILAASTYAQTTQPVYPSLVITAPPPDLDRRTDGFLGDQDNPLNYSHVDQLVDAGSIALTLTSGYCGGWTISISATDFAPQSGGHTFGAEYLAVTGIIASEGVPAPSTTLLTLSTAPQAVVSASYQPLAAGTYAYTLDLALTIPGGTPPGTYSSTLTVTTSAAP